MVIKLPMVGQFFFHIVHVSLKEKTLSLFWFCAAQKPGEQRQRRHHRASRWRFHKCWGFQSESSRFAGKPCKSIATTLGYKPLPEILVRLRFKLQTFASTSAQKYLFSIDNISKGELRWRRIKAGWYKITNISNSLRIKFNYSRKKFFTDSYCFGKTLWQNQKRQEVNVSKWENCRKFVMIESFAERRKTFPRAVWCWQQWQHNLVPSLTTKGKSKLYLASSDVFVKHIPNRLVRSDYLAFWSSLPSATYGPLTI